MEGFFAKLLLCFECYSKRIPLNSATIPPIHCDHPHPPWPPHSPSHSASSLLLIPYLLFLNSKDFSRLCFPIPYLSMPPEEEHTQLWGLGVRCNQGWIMSCLSHTFAQKESSSPAAFPEICCSGSVCGFAVGFGVPAKQLPSFYSGLDVNPWDCSKELTCLLLQWPETEGEHFLVDTEITSVLTANIQARRDHLSRSVPSM